MKSSNTTTCLNKGCQHCQGCHLRQAINDAANDLDEWAMAADIMTTTKAEDYVNLDKAIEVATLAG